MAEEHTIKVQLISDGFEQLKDNVSKLRSSLKRLGRFFSDVSALKRYNRELSFLKLSPEFKKAGFQIDKLGRITEKVADKTGKMTDKVVPMTQAIKLLNKRLKPMEIEKFSRGWSEFNREITKSLMPVKKVTNELGKMRVTTKKTGNAIDKKLRETLKKVQNDFRRFGYAVSRTGEITKKGKRGIIEQTKALKVLSRTLSTMQMQRVNMRMNNFNRELDKTKVKTGDAKDSLGRFKMELLGIMFFGMAMAGMFTGALQPALDAFGIFDLFSNMLLVTMIPAMETLQPHIMAITEGFMNLDPKWQWVIGMGAAVLALAGTFLFLAGQIGLGVDSLEKWIKNLKSKKVYKNLKNNLKDAGKWVKGLYTKLKDSKGFKAFGKAIDKLKNNVKKDGLVKGFTKSIRSLTTALKAKAIGLKISVINFLKEVKKKGIVNSFKTAIINLFNRLKNTKFVNMATGAFKKLILQLKKNWIVKGFMKDYNKLLLRLKITKHITNAKIAFSKLGRTILTKLGHKSAGMVSARTGMFGLNAAMLPIIVTIAVLALIVVFFYLAWKHNWGNIHKHFKTFKAGFDDIMKGLKMVLNGFIKFITGVFTGDFKGAWEGIKEIWEGVKTIFVKGLGKIIIAGNLFVVDLCKDIWDGIDDMTDGMLTRLADAASGIQQAFWNLLPPYVQDILKGVSNWASGIKEGIIKAVGLDVNVTPIEASKMGVSSVEAQATKNKQSHVTNNYAPTINVSGDFTNENNRRKIAKDINDSNYELMRQYNISGETP